MKKLKFGVIVGVLMVAFPVLFIVSITHATDRSLKMDETKEFPLVKTIPPVDEFVFTNSFITCPKPLN